MNEEYEEMGFMVELTDYEVRLLLHSVKEAIRVWPGSPARPAEEQEHLCKMRDDLFRMSLESIWEKRSEDDSPR
tara:strand:- start:2862 stop:3083 length:222 start_codon:yes stop_codon:yes gene_type:complete